MVSLEANSRCCCQLKQFEGICMAVKKHVYLYIACAASLIIWNMPFGCLPVNCEESNTVIPYKLLSTKKDSVSAVSFFGASEGKITE